jgi:Zn-dependent peptidase ImmA (M78 family)
MIMSQRAMNAANNLIKQFSQHLDCWPLLLEICKYFSIRIDEHPFRQKSFDGMLWYDRYAQQWVILVNAKAHRYRSRFTIAHEVGHFLLHRGLMESFCCTPDTATSDPLEREANAFASELLMPLEKLLPYITEYPMPDTRTASRHLGVSQAAIRLRIEMWQRTKQLPASPLWRLNPKYQEDEFYWPYSKVLRLKTGDGNYMGGC